MTLAPDSCFAAEVKGVLAATTSLVCYGQELAWLGMVLTRPQYRGRGFARMLVERALSVADERGVATIKLDATEQGIRLYEKLGFRREQHIERWVGIGLQAAGRRRMVNQLTPEEIEELDRRAMGARRSQLLKVLATRAEMISGEGSFVMQRPGRLARYLGPCVASAATSARRIIENCLSIESERWFWDILPANADAARVASDLGFKLDRRLVRMVRGASLAADPASLFAIAGFETG